MGWRTAYSLDTLLAETNALYPNRDKRTDGAISGYPGSQSSHNVNASGVVCALDITTGPYDGGITDSQGMSLAEQIRIALRDQPRGMTAYVIHHMEPPYVAASGPWIAHAGNNWAWTPYTGTDGHTSHIHVSVDWDIFTGGAASGQADYDTRLPWGLTTTSGQGSDVTPIEEDDMAQADIDEMKGNLSKLVPLAVTDAAMTKGMNDKLDELVGNMRKVFWNTEELKKRSPADIASDIDAAGLSKAVLDELAKRLAA